MCYTCEVKPARSDGLIEKDGEWHCGSESESLQEVGADGRKKLPPRLSWPWGRKSHLGFLPSRKRGPSPLASPNQLVHLRWQGWMDRGKVRRMRMRRCWECGMWYWQALKNAAEEAIDQKTKSPAGSPFDARLSDHKPPFNKIRTPSDVYQDTATPYLIFYTDKAPSIMFQSGQQLNSKARLSGSNLKRLENYPAQTPDWKPTNNGDKSINRW